jgi:hypothetical protein
VRDGAWHRIGPLTQSLSPSGGEGGKDGLSLPYGAKNPAQNALGGGVQSPLLLTISGTRQASPLAPSHNRSSIPPGSHWTLP